MESWDLTLQEIDGEDPLGTGLAISVSKDGSLDEEEFISIFSFDGAEGEATDALATEDGTSPSNVDVVFKSKNGDNRVEVNTLLGINLYMLECSEKLEVGSTVDCYRQFNVSRSRKTRLKVVQLRKLYI